MSGISLKKDAITAKNTSRVKKTHCWRQGRFLIKFFMFFVMEYLVVGHYIIANSGLGQLYMNKGSSLVTAKVSD